MNLIAKFISKTSFNESLEQRDLRIDFIRGIVMLVLVIVHSEFYSIFNIFVSERIGVVSGGEGFVILSGVVIGLTYRKYVVRNSLSAAASKLIDRASVLYATNIAIILIPALLTLLPAINPSSVQTYVDKPFSKIYPLYNIPLLDTNKLNTFAEFRSKADGLDYSVENIYYWNEEEQSFKPIIDNLQSIIAKVLLLRTGPHQYQIMGLYVILLLLTPIFLFALHNKKTHILMCFSWICYFYNWAYPNTSWPPGLIGAQFEAGFPLLTWQVLFINGVVIGWHKERLTKFLRGYRKAAILCASFFLFLIFFLFAQNNPDPTRPEFLRLYWLSEQQFLEIYQYFLKNELGVLRLLNYAVVLIVTYSILTWFWEPIRKLFGWFFIPIGQASLYVFIVHIFIVLLLNQFAVFWEGAIWISTFGHTLALLILWILVKYKVLFKIIPR